MPTPTSSVCAYNNTTRLYFSTYLVHSKQSTVCEHTSVITIKSLLQSFFCWASEGTNSCQANDQEIFQAIACVAPTLALAQLAQECVGNGGKGQCWIVRYQIRNQVKVSEHGYLTTPGQIVT